MNYLDNFELKFDMDTRPVQTLMSVSCLRNKNIKTRYFTADGSYSEIKTGIESLRAESVWINQFRRFYIEHPDSLFFLSIITGKNKESCNTLDQILIDRNSFLELKSEIQNRRISDSFETFNSLPLSPLFYLERINDTGTVFLYTIYSIPVSELTDNIVYNKIYSLCMQGDFFLHEHGIYNNDPEHALLYTRQYVHDGLLVHDTEYPWFQKKYELIGNIQSAASLFIMISSVLLMNEIIKLPCGWLVFTFLIALGVYIFIVSRRNTKKG
ncbi:hypothetical protein SAMN05216356_101180 [Oribacterium sp. WCC10]|nr:hypothetical protein SAMN05216356_101180 [Oribacterium sp. WCC10]